MSTIFNKTSTSKAQFSKELKLSVNIKGNDGNPTNVSIGYVALFSNNDILMSIADMSQDELNDFKNKLILSVQEAGLRSERAKRTIEFV